MEFEHAPSNLPAAKYQLRGYVQHRHSGLSTIRSFRFVANCQPRSIGSIGCDIDVHGVYLSIYICMSVFDPIDSINCSFRSIFHCLRLVGQPWAWRQLAFQGDAEWTLRSLFVQAAACQARLPTTPKRNHLAGSRRPPSAPLVATSHCLSLPDLL